MCSRSLGSLMSAMHCHLTYPLWLTLMGPSVPWQSGLKVMPLLGALKLSTRFICDLSVEPLGAGRCAHKVLKRRPVETGVTDALKSVDLKVSTSLMQGPTWKSWGLVQAIPLIRVLPPSPRPDCIVCGLLSALPWLAVWYFQETSVFKLATN